jgi:iron complex outermembrane recepter protein
MARDRWSVPTVKVLIALCLVLGSSLVPVLELNAQTPQATLTGMVLDASRGALPGVTVTLAPHPFGTPRSTVTDAAGRYSFEALAAGDYRLQASLSGFGTREALVTLAAGEIRTFDVTLEITPFTETVTVTVTRTEQEQARVPNAVSVIEGDVIQAFTRRASPAETFAGVPGFYVENRRNFSLSGGVRFAIRAPLPRFGMRGVQILQDGIPMTMADGTTEPTNIDMGSLGRVEVLRGPSSVLYGNSAGGVITLQSEFPASRLIIQPDVQWGSYGYEQQQLKVAGTTPKVSYLVNANRMETDGFRLHSHAEVRRANLVVRAAPTNTTEIRGVFNVYDLPFGESASTVTLADARDNPTSVRPQAFTQGWGESTTQQQTGLTLQHQITDGHVIRATGWGVWRDVWNPIPAAVVTVDRRAAGFRSEYAGSALPRAVPLTWTTGFDVSLQHDERAEYGNNGVPPGGGLTQEGALRLAQLEEVRSVSPFVHVTAQLGDRWSVTGGARYDRYHFRATDRFLSNGDQSGERTLDAVSPMIGATFVPSSWLNLYSNFATAYQTPTTVELSNRPTDEGGFNDDLGPENLRSFEVGARGAITPWRARFEVASYFSTIDNAIVRFQRADEQAYFRNAGEVTRNGLEVLFEWAPTPRVTGRVSYTFQDFQYGQFVAPEGDFSDNTEPGAPPHQVVIGGTYHAPFGLFTSAQFRFVDAYPVNSTNTIENWAYQVVDLRLGFDRRWNGLRVRPFFSIDNLFNERYNSSAIVNSIGDRFFEPSPWREYAVGLTLGFDRF